MDEHGFRPSAEYDRLLAYREPATGLEPQTEFANLKRDAFLLLEIYSYLLLCNQLVLDKQMNALFAKYIEP